MTDIQFDEEQKYQPIQRVEQKPLFIRLVLATKIVSTDRAAEYVLIGFAVISIVISLFLFFGGK